MDETPDAEALRRNFRWMSICFSVADTGLLVPLVYATSVVKDSPDVGYAANGALYLATTASTLFMAVPIASALGLRESMRYGLLLQGLYAIFFAVTDLIRSHAPGSPLLGPVFIVGSLLSGLGAGVQWTAQGSYMACSAALVADATNEPREQVTAQLAGDFALIFLVTEVSGKLLSSALLGVGLGFWALGALLSASTVAAVLAASQLYDLTVPEAAPLLSGLLATTRCWSNPKLWLLSPTNLTFGFAAAYMNGYVNGSVARPALGDSSIGILTAATVIVAAALSKAYTWGSQSWGKGAIIALGGLSFACIPLLGLTGAASSTVFLVLLYALQGSGRAVYESTNKSVFADHFPGEEKPAFANCMFQNSIASVVCYFGSTFLPASRLEIIVLLLAISTPVAYGVVGLLSQDSRVSERTPLSEKQV